MKRLRLGLSATIAALAAVALSAQTSSTGAQGNRVTVTGCIERAPAGTDEELGSTGKEPGPIFVLTKASEESGAAGTTGTSGTSERRSKTEYRLQTTDVSELAGYEGAAVEITGTLVGRQAAAGRHGKPAARRTPTLKIVSMKTVSSNCGG